MCSSLAARVYWSVHSRLEVELGVLSPQPAVRPA